MIHQLTLQSHFTLPREPALDPQRVLDGLYPLAEALAREDRYLPIDGWSLIELCDDRMFYTPAFVGGCASAEAVAKLREQQVCRPSLCSFDLFDGQGGEGSGSYIEFAVSRAATLLRGSCGIQRSLQGYGRRYTFDARATARLVLTLAGLWRAHAVAAFPNEYRHRGQQIFEDRPTVGWMLYLPRVVSRRQVPEAADLVPAFTGDRQTGTLIVTTYEPFDPDHLAHVDAARRIELRLVDQDLLPTLAQTQLQLVEPI